MLLTIPSYNMSFVCYGMMELWYHFFGYRSVYGCFFIADS
jgi:hypothetical protein